MYSGSGDYGVSETSFIIQVKSGQKWATATRLPNDTILKKLMPALQHEYGETVRALRGEKDAFTGKTKWRLYKVETAELRSARQTTAFAGSKQTPPPETGSNSKPTRPPRKKFDFKKRFLEPLEHRARSHLVDPVKDRLTILIDRVKALAATPNKIERLRHTSSGVLSQVNHVSQDPRAMWLASALSIAAGLTLAFTASFPGGLTLAVLSCVLVPPFRDFITSIPSPNFRLASPGRRALAVLLLLATSASLELGMPDRRQANFNHEFFAANRGAILERAQASLEARDYVAVISQLAPYRSVDDGGVQDIILVAQPGYDRELARQEKINSQFLFNGSNRFLTEYIVKSIDDPGSFRHLNTDYWIHDEYLEVQTTYSSLNDAGSIVANTIKAYVDFDGRIINYR